MSSALVSDGERIEPFWQRLPAIFTYPAKPAALAPIAGLSVLNLLKVVPGIGFYLGALLWLAAYKFAYEVLAHTAGGHLQPPQTQYIANTDFMAVKQFFLMFVLVGMLLLVASFGGYRVLTVLAGLFLLLALPASIMVLAMTRSLLDALNPITWIEIMRRIGAGYLIGAFFLALMVSGMLTVEYFLVPQQGAPWYMGPLFYFVQIYFMVAMFHLMGYMIYQYHDELGVEPSATRKPLPGHGDAADKAMLDEAQTLVAEGDIEQAIDKLKREINSRGAIPQVHDHYRKLLHIQGDKTALLEHGREYTMILYRALEQPKKALQVVADCFDVDPGFDLRDAALVTELAEFADRFGSYKVALKLTSGFARKYPDNRHIAQNYFLAAKIMADKLNQDDKALALLHSLLKKYPDHTLAPKIRQYAQMLESIAGTSLPLREDGTAIRDSHDG